MPLIFPRRAPAGLCWIALFTLRLAAADDAPRLTLTSPLDYQVFQRADLKRGAIAVEGQWSISRRAALVPDALDVKLNDEDAWHPLPFHAGARGFRATLPLAPGGWYRVQVRLRHGADTMASQDIAHVGIGEVFIVAGQSNSANYGEEKQQPQSGLVTAFDGERWAIASDPQPGATGTKGSFIPAFGDTLTRRLHVPVGVVCIGVGSTSVREWLPAGRTMSAPPTTGLHCVVLAGGQLVSSGELFEKLAGRLRHFPAQGVRAVLWHQGESDWHQPAGHDIPIAEYRADLAEVIAGSRGAVGAGWDVPWLVAQASYESPENPGSAEFRAAQASVTDGRLTFPGPNTDELGRQWRENNGRGVHFSAAGQKRHGELWAKVVGDWIESGH